MSGSHEKLPRLFWVQIVLVLVVGVLYLFAPAPKGHGEAEAQSPEQKQMIAALDPIGSVAIKEEAAAPGAARSGDDIVKANCAVCHSIGLANAPKLEAGAKGDWETRLAGDMSALVQSAVTGKGGMPPRGGDPSLTDEEIQNAIVAMLASAGVEAAATAPVSKEVASEAPAAEAAAHSVARSGDDVVKANCAVCHSIGLANAPKLEAGAKGDWETRLAGDMSALVQSAVTGKGGMPPRGGDPSLTDEEMQNAIVAMLASAGVEAAVPASEEVGSEAPAEATQSVDAKPAAAAVSAADVVSSKLGESTYKAACFACHDTGVANSPIIGDKVAWAPRIELGMTALYNTAVKGDPAKPTMPAKGGNPTLSDEAVKAAVDYMVVQSR